MEQDDAKDLARVKDLLKHTSEFIAYFELAETKMLQWQEEMRQQTARLEQQAQAVQSELNAINTMLSEAGISRFRITAEQALTQGEANLRLLEDKCNQFVHQLQEQQEHINVFTQGCIEKIELHSTKTIEVITQELAQYDVNQFHRIASESCDHVERLANHTVSKSKKLLGMFQLRHGLFAVFTTILTTFLIVLYLSDELPWEMHHQAVNERKAGKVLLDAWPKLSQEEKAKILNDDIQGNDG